jgi:hypothetical protein
LQLPLKAARKHPGRQELPAELPRTEQLIACTPEQCGCGNCGKQTAVIGYAVHAACWAHARRKFFEALKVNPKDQSSIGIVAQMDVGGSDSERNCATGLRSENARSRLAMGVYGVSSLVPFT